MPSTRRQKRKLRAGSVRVAPLPGTRAQPHPLLLTTFLRSKTTALKPPSPQLGELDLAGYRRNYAKHESFTFLPRKRVKKVWKRAVFAVCNSTLKIHDYKWMGGTNSSVRLSFTLGNDRFNSILLHLQVGVNITLPLHADGWVKKNKKLIWNKLTTLPRDERSSLPPWSLQDSLRAGWAQSLLGTDGLVDLPWGEQPQSATRTNNHGSSGAGNERCSGSSELALPACFKGEPTSCSSQPVTSSL